MGELEIIGAKALGAFVGIATGTLTGIFYGAVQPMGEMYVMAGADILYGITGVFIAESLMKIKNNNS